MQRILRVVAGLLTAVLASLGGSAQAQIYVQPQAPTTYPQPVPSGNLLQPYYIPPTNYNMTGPSAGTLGYTTTTSYYIRCAPYGDRFVPATTLLPVYGYTPGYYRGYYTPLFYRY